MEPICSTDFQCAHYYISRHPVHLLIIAPHTFNLRVSIYTFLFAFMPTQNDLHRDVCLYDCPLCVVVFKQMFPNQTHMQSTPKYSSIIILCCGIYTITHRPLAAHGCHCPRAYSPHRIRFVCVPHHDFHPNNAPVPSICAQSDNGMRVRCDHTSSAVHITLSGECLREQNYKHTSLCITLPARVYSISRWVWRRGDPSLSHVWIRLNDALRGMQTTRPRASTDANFE